MRTALLRAAGLPVAALIIAVAAGCGSSGNAPRAPRSSAPAVTAPAITTSPPPPAPLITAAGPAAVECTLFIPVWQQIESDTAGQGILLLGDVVQAHAQQWQDALMAASESSTATQASVAIAQAGAFVGFEAPIGNAGGFTQQDWGYVTSNLAKALQLCTGQ
jgi:hypothetical protein